MVLYKKSSDDEINQQLGKYTGLPQLTYINDLENVVEGVNISTITIICKIPTDLYIPNICKYIDLEENRLVTVKFGDFATGIRTIKHIIPKVKKKKIKKSFYNQTSIIVQLGPEKYVNVKLFKNGSLQITGCRSVRQFIKALIILFEELRALKAVLDSDTCNKIVEKPFVADIAAVDIAKVFDVNIAMINCGFRLNFQIDRMKLYRCILDDKIECTYEPIVHACVNLKYAYSEKKSVSIFVFESGSILITGATQKDHINKSYKFIIDMLYKNYNRILLTNIEEFIHSKDIDQFIKQWFTEDAIKGRKVVVTNDFFKATVKKVR